MDENLSHKAKKLLSFYQYKPVSSKESTQYT